MKLSRTKHLFRLGCVGEAHNVALLPAFAAHIHDELPVVRLHLLGD